MKLSQLVHNDVARLCKDASGERFIVIQRWPEDRSSGGTTVQFENGKRKDFWWDNENPEVTYLGRGQLQLVIVLTKPA